MHKRTISTLVLLALLAATAACGPHLGTITPVEVGHQSMSQEDLARLPRPKGKIPVAVYSFRDQSGQYKYTSNYSSFSTAVTQGATAMLLQALERSGWFIPVEREGLNNLLTERKIIRAKLPENKEMQSLTHAPLLLEGGIVAYETNVLTGGAGLEYYGIGGSTQARKDQVTLILRAVNVTSGEIMQSVLTSKAILSTEIRAGVFRFVALDRLLEIEAGLTYNEPPQMCVMEAVEKAVFALVVEGILKGLWELEDPKDINSPIILKYIRERSGVIRERPGSRGADRQESARDKQP